MYIKFRKIAAQLDLASNILLIHCVYFKYDLYSRNSFVKHFKYVQVTKLKLLIGICNWFWFAFLLRLKLNYQQK